MSNFTHTVGVAAFAMAVGLAGTALGQFTNLSDHTGRVAQYDLASDGTVAGLILQDGTEAILPPDAAGELVAVARPGDLVTVRGRVAEPRTTVIDAVAVVNNATGEMAGVGAFGGERPYAAQGTVQHPLHDATGALNGALLEDGTIVRLPPGAAAANAHRLEAGKPIYIRGYAEEGPLGRVVLADQIGASAAEASQIAVLSPGR
jgi:hypothetical protein